ncbi:hypothetical protein [Dactylosporangium maewongense]|uniref:RNA polymerase sigma factor n=1 Tax=Dactylosporangium maewongense TaxID=634393 RepID=UPI0031DEF6B4
MNAAYDRHNPEGSWGVMFDYSARVSGHVDDLLDEIRDEPEFVEVAEQRDTAMRRLDEQDLIERIAFEALLSSRSEGQAYHQLFDDLWLYGWPVIKAFLRLNRMGHLVQRYSPRLYVAMTPEDMVVLHQSEEERDALAIDVISRAVEDFYHRAVLDRGWKQDGGASLRTWFIGACALNFPRAYQRWSRARSDRIGELAVRYGLDLDEVGAHLAGVVPDPERVVIDRSDLRAMIDMAQPTTKVILGLIMQGKSQAQIAGELGLTLRAVEGRLYRFRQRVLKRQRAAGMRLLLPWKAAA